MNDSPDTAAPPRRQRQFTIRAILFATLLVAVAAAGFSGLVRAQQDDRPTAFVLFVIAAPLALVVLLNLARAIAQFVTLRRTKNRTESDSE